MKVTFEEFFPKIPSFSYMFMLEAMTYRTTLCIRPSEVESRLDPLDAIVQVWTSQYDREHCEGKWHPVDLPYVCTSSDGTHHTFGQSVIITSDRDFRFTFRVRLPGDTDFRWSHGYGVDGVAHVEAPRLRDSWTLGPEYQHIGGAVHVGNFIAATNARDCGFTHVLNVADNLDMVYADSDDVVYHKILMVDGAHNPIKSSQIWEAVTWLQRHDRRGNKILVNCRAGIGRAGSVGVAFVYAHNPTMTYEEAYSFVFERHFVYPHAGLQQSLFDLFPRMG